MDIEARQRVRPFLELAVSRAGWPEQSMVPPEGSCRCAVQVGGLSRHHVSGTTLKNSAGRWYMSNPAEI